MKRTELNYHLYHLHLNCPKLTPVYRTHNTMQKYCTCRTQFCLIIFFHSIPSIPSMSLKPLLGHGLPQKTPQFFSIFCLSPPFSYSWDLQCVTLDDVIPPCFWVAHYFLQQSKILYNTLRRKLNPSDGVHFKMSVKLCINDVNISRRNDMTNP